MVGEMRHRRRARRSQPLLLHAVVMTHFPRLGALLTLPLVEVIPRLRVVDVQASGVRLVVLVVDLHAISCETKNNDESFTLFTERERYALSVAVNIMINIYEPEICSALSTEYSSSNRM